MTFRVKIFGLIIIILTILSSIQTKGKITRIDQSNFQKFSKDNSYWIIQISQTPCNQCPAHQKELSQAADLLEGACKIGKVDAKFLNGMKITQNPTYLFLRSDKIEENVQYTDKKLAKVSLAKFCLDQVQKAVKKRHKTLFGDSKNNRESSETKKSSSNSSGKKYDGTKIIDLTDNDFQNSVLKSKQAWFVLFYSPSCGHCKNLEPQFDKLPSLMGKKVNIARIDATVSSKTAQKYQIKGFPTMLLFESDGKQKPIPYQGQRTAQQIQNWLNQKKLSKTVKQLHELNQKNYEWYCNRNIVCLIYILDNKNQKSGIKFIKPLLEQLVDKPFELFYSGRIPQFESYLMIDDRKGPIMVSTWQGINSYRIYNGGNNYDENKQFIEHIMDRRKWIKFQQKSSQLLFSSKSSEL